MHQIAAFINQVSTAKGRARYGRFSIEGTRLFERAVRAHVPITHALVGELFGQNERERALLDALQATDCTIAIAPDVEMMELTNGRSLGAILGLINTPTPPPLIEILTGRPLLLTAVEIVDPGNVGAMVRTAHALGATAFVTIGVSDPFHPKAVRTAMGSLFKLPIYRFPTLSPFLDALRRHEIPTIATVSDDGVPLPEARLSAQGGAVLMGNEYWGLDEAVITAVSQRVTIPMADGIDSFSVNAAAAIMLYGLQNS
jgi:TrmH family RNA methyltransferase